MNIQETPATKSCGASKRRCRFCLLWRPDALVLRAQVSQVGLSVAEIGTMTGLNFAGSSEFAAIQLWGSPPPVLMIVLITLLINSRHVVMGAALAAYLRHLPTRKVLPALLFMADEGWAISFGDTLRRSVNQRTPAFSWPFYWGVCVSVYPVWGGQRAGGRHGRPGAGGH